MSEKKTRKKKADVAPQLALDGGIFENLTEKVDVDMLYDETRSTSSEKLDIALEMAAADQNYYGFWNDLPPNLQKQISPLVLMRWFSVVDDRSYDKEQCLLLVNNVLNTDFWELKDHVELQWKLLAMCGPGHVVRHNWIPMAKRRKISKIKEFMLQWYPSANDLELELLTNKLTRDDFEQFAKSTGATDSDIKELLEHFDNDRGIEPQEGKKAGGKKR